MPKVSIIDYGMGNILSVQRSFEKCGGITEVVSTKEKIINADYLVLPGVGAFKNAMIELEKLGLINVILEYCKRENPFLGICLGMQLMMEESYEFGKTKGLGLIPGAVIRIEDTSADGIPHKVPFIGWNGIKAPINKKVLCWEKTILAETYCEDFFYFVHSYTAKPDNNHLLAEADYNGRSIAAVIKKGNAYGCQFHPEKSGEDGLKIIQAFMSL